MIRDQKLPPYPQFTSILQQSIDKPRFRNPRGWNGRKSPAQSYIEQRLVAVLARWIAVDVSGVRFNCQLPVSCSDALLCDFKVACRRPSILTLRDPP